MKHLYLIVDLCSLLPTIFFSFHPKIKFYQHWKYAWVAIFSTAIPFIIWDMYYTHLGVWGFNENYISGVRMANLPIEEILFFICIPYACLYTYFCFKRFISSDYLQKYLRGIVIALLIFLIILAIYFNQQLYTSVTFSLLAMLIILFHFRFKVTWLSRAFFTYAFLLIPFMIVNGILTGTGIEGEVVWYNPSEIMGLRILTIPFEDIFYGMLMFICSVAIYEQLSTRNQQPKIS